jgi:hypothetical protein
MSQTFADILGTEIDNIAPPKLVPLGTWLLRGVSATSKNITYKDKSTGDDREAKLFNFRFEPAQAGPDVNAEDVNAAEYEGKPIYHSIFVRLQSDGQPNKRSAEGLKEFLQTLSLTDTDPLDSFEGKFIMAQVVTAEKKNRDGNVYLDNALKDFEPASNFRG